MYVIALSSGVSVGQKRDSDPIIDASESPCACWELNSGLLEEQPVLLTTEPISPAVLFVLQNFSWMVVAHTFNLSTQEAEAGRSL